MLPQIDEEGYLVPACDRWCDVLTELELLDPEAGDPLDWPEWTDADVWELGPAPDDEAYLPTEAEWGWLNEHDPRPVADRDVIEAHAVCAVLDAIEAERRD